MPLAVGDLVRVVNNTRLRLGMGQQFYVTGVNADGTIEIEGTAGRFMAHRFELVV